MTEPDSESFATLLLSLSALTQAIQDQTKAITHLAQSNQALVAAMADADGQDMGEDGPITRYMDGSPVRDYG